MQEKGTGQKYVHPKANTVKVRPFLNKSQFYNNLLIASVPSNASIIKNGRGLEQEI